MRETIWSIPVLNGQMKFCFVIFFIALVATGCVSRSRSRLEAQNAFLAGQNAALQQQQEASGVTVLGAVQTSKVPWVEGLTLTQAVATANYIGLRDPKQIILTRQGESAVLEPKVLLSGAVVLLEPGDVVEIR
jgi:hypothetical protein